MQNCVSNDDRLHSGQPEGDVTHPAISKGFRPWHANCLIYSGNCKEDELAEQEISVAKKSLETILIASGSRGECGKLCKVLNDSRYGTVVVHAVEQVEESARANGVRVVFFDLDSFSLDNRFIKMFRKRNPGVSIFALSSRLLHPELQESMSTEISACLRKPIDAEEMLYLLRSIIKKEHGARDSPQV